MKYLYWGLFSVNCFGVAFNLSQKSYVFAALNAGAAGLMYWSNKKLEAAKKLADERKAFYENQAH